MKRLIDLQTALDLLEKDINENGEPPESDYNIGINHARCVISTIPSAQPERKKGRWIHDGRDFPHGCDWIHCSVCGKRGINVPADVTNFCPNCGARMDGGEQDETD